MPFYRYKCEDCGEEIRSLPEDVRWELATSAQHGGHLRNWLIMWELF